MNYNEVLRRYSYESDDNIKRRLNKLDKEDYKENRDVINAIVLWKLNRSVAVTNDTLDLLNLMAEIKDPLDAIGNLNFNKLIMQLLSSKGIKLAVASTILHFYNPSVFPIIDQRSYRELFHEDFPNYTSKDSDRMYIDLYKKYIKGCCEYNTTNCPDIPFEYIDKILYQLDKDKKNKVKY